jgi:hypothetical protein
MLVCKLHPTLKISSSCALLTEYRIGLIRVGSNEVDVVMYILGHKEEGMEKNTY